MSEVSREESQQVLVPPFNAHVFRCPYCKDYTTLLSIHTFICNEQTECENCGREFAVENDRAHSLAYAEVSHH
jgi:transcription elongation factor Elf1